MGAAEDCSAGTRGAGPGNLGGGRSKGSSLTGQQPSQETLKRKTCKRVEPFPPGQDTLPKSPPMSCTSSADTQNNFTGRLRPASARPNKAAGATWGSSDYPKHDEPVDPGSEGLANHADVFTFIIPGRNMTTLFINSPSMLPFPLLHTYTCHSLAVCYVTNCSTALLPSSGDRF